MSKKLVLIGSPEDTKQAVQLLTKDLPPHTVFFLGSSGTKRDAAFDLNDTLVFQNLTIDEHVNSLQYDTLLGPSIIWTIETPQSEIFERIHDLRVADIRAIKSFHKS